MERRHFFSSSCKSTVICYTALRATFPVSAIFECADRYALLIIFVRRSFSLHTPKEIHIGELLHLIYISCSLGDLFVIEQYPRGALLAHKRHVMSVHKSVDPYYGGIVIRCLPSVDRAAFVAHNGL